jgi:hypothetical protein
VENQLDLCGPKFSDVERERLLVISVDVAGANLHRWTTYVACQFVLIAGLSVGLRHAYLLLPIESRKGRLDRSAVARDWRLMPQPTCDDDRM